MKRGEIRLGRLQDISPQDFMRAVHEARVKSAANVRHLLEDVYMRDLGFDLNGQWWDIGGMDSITTALPFFMNGGRVLRNIEPFGLAREEFHRVAGHALQYAIGRKAFFEHHTVQDMLAMARAGKLTDEQLNMIEGMFLIKPVDDDETLYKSFFELGRELAKHGLHTIITVTDKANYNGVARQGYKRKFKPVHVNNQTNSVIWRPNW